MIRRIFRSICIMICFSTACFHSTSLYAQEKTVQFYDVIEEDSVVMYFNRVKRFCKKECADYRRYTRINANGDFTGDFYDSSGTGSLLAKGRYENGAKNGFFFIVIPSQQLYSEGSYKNNLPTGVWQYYYFNGKPERKLVVSDTDTLLMDFFDSNGLQWVKDGNGFFNGRVHVPQSRMDNRVVAKGKIENGKTVGEWTSVISGAAYNKETLSNGRLVSGSTTGTAHRKSIQYDDYSVITNFLLETHIDELEQFNVSDQCAGVRSYAGNEQGSKPMDLQNFYSSLTQDIGGIIERDIKEQNYGDYQYGENRLTIQFKINDKGVPTDITKISTWGGQFVDMLTRNLKQHTKFNNRGGQLYFHLVINKNDGNLLTYRYNFSSGVDR